MRGRTALPFVDRSACLVTLDRTPEGLRRLIPAYLPGYDLTADELWSHSIAVAAMAEALAHRAGVDPELAFRAGLFHDMGKITLARHLAEYNELDAALERGDMSLAEIEQVLSGTDHGEVGGKVAAGWRLEPAVIAAATWHHAPFYVPEPALAPIVDLVHCADLLAMDWGYSREYGERPRRPDPISLQRLGETVSSLREVSETGIRRLRDLLDS